LEEARSQEAFDWDKFIQFNGWIYLCALYVW
jgi:hypothetical protein